MAEIDLTKLTALAESAERRAKELHADYEKAKQDAEAWRAISIYGYTADMDAKVASLLNDFFYWSGKATSYRGVIAMVELQTVIEDELDAEARCP